MGVPNPNPRLDCSNTEIESVPQRYAPDSEQASNYLFAQKFSESNLTANNWPPKNGAAGSASSFAHADQTFGNGDQVDWSRTLTSSRLDAMPPLMHDYSDGGGTNRQTNEDRELEPVTELSKRDQKFDSFAMSKDEIGRTDETRFIFTSERENMEMQRALEASAMERIGVSNQSEDPRDRRRLSPNEPVGLCNIGNTCYFNSLLQLYFHLDDFRRSILAFCPPPDYHCQPPGSPKSSSPLGGGVNSSGQPSPRHVAIDFVIELQRLFATMALGVQKFADPTRLFQVMQKSGPNVALGNQEDAQEFAFKLLEIAERALEDPASGSASSNHESMPENQSASLSDAVGRASDRAANSSDEVSHQEGSSFPAKKDGNFVKKLFTMHVRYETTLDDTSEELRKLKPDGVLSTFTGDESPILININGLSDHELYDGLDDFTRQKVDYRVDLEDQETKNVQAVKRMLFARLPPILTVWLKRHTYNRESGAGKAEGKFRFHQEIALDRYLEVNRKEADKIRNEVESIRLKRRSIEEELSEFRHFPHGASFKDPGGESKMSHGCTGEQGRVSDSLLTALKRVQRRVQSAADSKHNSMYVAGLNSAEVERALLTLDKIIEHDQSKCERLQRELDSMTQDERTAYSEMEKEKYHLQAVLIHEGAESEGHYWTYIRNSVPLEGTDAWIKFNDRLVSYVSEKEMWKASLGGKGQPSSAYCIVYVRNDDQEAARLDKEPMDLVKLSIAEEAKNLLPRERLAEIKKQNDAYERDVRLYEEKLANAEICETARALIHHALAEMKNAATPSVPITTSSSDDRVMFDESAYLRRPIEFLITRRDPKLALVQALVEVWAANKETGDKSFLDQRAEDLKEEEFPPVSMQSTENSVRPRPSRIMDMLILTLSAGPGSDNWPQPYVQVVTHETTHLLADQLGSRRELEEVREALSHYEAIRIIALRSVGLQSAALYRSFRGEWSSALDFWCALIRSAVAPSSLPGISESQLTRAALDFKKGIRLDLVGRPEDHLPILRPVVIAASEHSINLLLDDDDRGTNLGIKAARVATSFYEKGDFTFRTLLDLWESYSRQWSRNPRHQMGFKVAEDVLKVLKSPPHAVIADLNPTTSSDMLARMNAIMDEAVKDPEKTIRDCQQFRNQMFEMRPTVSDSRSLREVAEELRVFSVMCER